MITFSLRLSLVFTLKILLGDVWFKPNLQHKYSCSDNTILTTNNNDYNKKNSSSTTFLPPPYFYISDELLPPTDKTFVMLPEIL